MLITKPFTTVYVAKPDYLTELCQELGEVAAVMGNLVFSSEQRSDLCFALDAWLDPVLLSFDSISEAVKILKKAGKFWYLNPLANIRRSHLIQEQLRKIPTLSREFPLENELPELGCFSLLDKNTLIYSSKRWKKWPLGHCEFIEDKKNPPNRAYLKLWEALTLLNHYPKAGEKTVDLGASPGGWTYVLQALGAGVTAVDKAPLDPSIAKLPRVTFLQTSAFALNPKEWEGEVDWLLGDIACYPDRLYGLVTQWIAAKKAKQMIFTIKLQGQTDLEMLRQFQAIPNSRTLHLFHNKHEATFFYPVSETLSYSFASTTDQEFLLQFENCTLPKEQFKHLNHLRLAWLYLCRYPLDEALTRIKQSIIRYATSIGAASVYHETLTQFWIQLIHQSMRDESSFESFIKNNPELLTKDLPQQYYSTALLDSAAARQQWLEPDLKPLSQKLPP